MKSFHIFPLALVGAALTTPLAAQAPTRTVIHAGHLLAEPGKPARGASTIIVEDGRILSIADGHQAAGRSEEHTSELQSLMRTSYAVFCLKKKNKYITTHKT